MSLIKKTLVFCLFSLMFSCGSSKTINTAASREVVSTSKVLYQGGNGFTIEDAIIIKASNSSDGIEAEYSYISQKQGRRGTDYNVLKQALIHKGKKNYDVISIELLPSQEEVKYFFDITSFFGKF